MASVVPEGNGTYSYTLDQVLPEWEQIRLLPHASVIHRFTVDRHVVETCIEALDRGVEGVVILDGKTPHCVLLELFTERGAGTLITR